MTHEATLGAQWGYRLKKRISVNGNDLVVETELVNMGNRKFTTPHYSHNFLSADSVPIGPGWLLSLDLNMTSYDDSSWAAPLHHYFEHNASSNSISAINVPDTI